MKRMSRLKGPLIVSAVVLGAFAILPLLISMLNPQSVSAISGLAEHSRWWPWYTLPLRAALYGVIFWQWQALCRWLTARNKWPDETLPDLYALKTRLLIMAIIVECFVNLSIPAHLMSMLVFER